MMGITMKRQTIIFILLIFIFSCSSGGDDSSGNASSFPAENIISLNETDPVDHSGDAADDCAIWINSIDITLSRIIGTDKKGGLVVYDLSGKLTAYLNDGKMNNVDLRYDFTLSGNPVCLIAASNRSNKSISLYKMNDVSLLPENIANRIIYTDFSDVGGICMYKSRISGLFYVFITDQSGHIEQWRLFDSGSGTVDAIYERTLSVGSTAEGCVADDEDGLLYVAEEHGGIWIFDAEPSGSITGRKVINLKEEDYLQADLEGLTIFKTPENNKYLIASVQGNDSFAIFHITSTLQWMGSFRLTDNIDKGIDKVTHTDGIDVYSGPINSDYPEGIFIAQDDNNTPSGLNQNFKFASLAEIIARFNL